eukprot:3463652-Amphidinium_carterae.3
MVNRGKNMTKKNPSQQECTKPKSTIIPKYMFFGKASLASYPDADGSPLYMRDHEDLKSLLSASSIMASRSNKNSEFLSRPGMAIALGCSAMDTSMTAMFGDASEVLQTALKQFSTKECKAFGKAVHELNVGKDGELKSAKASKCLQTMVQFFEKYGKSDAMQEALVDVIRITAQLYLGSMAFLEMFAVTSKRKVYAKKLQQVKDLSKPMQDFLKKSNDTDCLIQGFVAELMKKISTAIKERKKLTQNKSAKKGGKKAGNKKKKSDSSDSDTDAEESEDEEKETDENDEEDEDKEDDDDKDENEESDEESEDEPKKQEQEGEADRKVESQRCKQEAQGCGERDFNQPEEAEDREPEEAEDSPSIPRRERSEPVSRSRRAGEGDGAGSRSTQGAQDQTCDPSFGFRRVLVSGQRPNR